MEQFVVDITIMELVKELQTHQHINLVGNRTINTNASKQVKIAIVIQNKLIIQMMLTTH
jgi:hypothetical protein